MALTGSRFDRGNSGSNSRAKQTESVENATAAFRRPQAGSRLLALFVQNELLVTGNPQAIQLSAMLDQDFAVPLE